MLNKSKYIALICGALSVAVTIAFYLMVFENVFTIPIRWVSLLFLVLSEMIFTIKAFVVNRSIFGVSSIVASGIHILFVLIMSIIFVNVFPIFIKNYALLNVWALCVLLMVDAIITYFGNRVNAQNAKLSGSQSLMQACVEKAASLSVQYGDTEHKKKLQEITELLRYSDNSCLSDDEITIMNQLDEVKRLLSDNSDEVDAKLDEIKNIIKLRSIKVAEAKRGKY